MYDSFKIGGLVVKNRLLRSATFEFGAADGRITQEMIRHYRSHVAGGSGLMITGMHAVSAGGRSNPAMAETTYDGYVEDMRQAADAVHENGSLLFVQLNHAGYKTAQGPGYDCIGVSQKQVDPARNFREADVAEIGKIAVDFGEAARRCQEAGCDGVQIHAGHGYLLNTFLSPYYNRRRDAYGGPIENRARILFQAYNAVRSAVGKDFPVGIKIPFSDRVTPSISPDDSLYVCKELERQGIDMIEITAGLTIDGGAFSFTPSVQQEDQEASFLAGAAQIAHALENGSEKGRLHFVQPLFWFKGNRRLPDEIGSHRSRGGRKGRRNQMNPHRTMSFDCKKRYSQSYTVSFCCKPM